MPNKLCIDAGPALDDAIATKVVGIEKVRGIWAYWTRQPERWEVYDPKVHRQYLAGTEDNLPMVYQYGQNFPYPNPLPYSSDLSCAFKLVEFMRKDGFSFKLWQPADLGQIPGYPMTKLAVVSFVCSAGPCDRHGTNFHNHHGAYDVEAGTVPLAIARAALFAKKVEI